MTAPTICTIQETDDLGSGFGIRKIDLEVYLQTYPLLFTLCQTPDSALPAICHRMLITSLSRYLITLLCPLVNPPSRYISTSDVHLHRTVKSSKIDTPEAQIDKLIRLSNGLNLESAYAQVISVETVVQSREHLHLNLIHRNPLVQGTTNRRVPINATCHSNSACKTSNLHDKATVTNLEKIGQATTQPRLTKILIATGTIQTERLINIVKPLTTVSPLHRVSLSTATSRVTLKAIRQISKTNISIRIRTLCLI